MEDDDKDDEIVVEGKEDEDEGSEFEGGVDTATGVGVDTTARVGIIGVELGDAGAAGGCFFNRAASTVN